MKFKFNSAILSILVSFAVWSCGGSCGSKDKDKTSSDEFAQAQNSPNAVSQEIKDLKNKVPRPSEIPYMLQATGAEFNQSLVNDRKKASSYESQTDKTALNLGVYAADIGYFSSYEKTQESIDYLNVCKGLADKLGLTNAFDKSILQDFEKNIDKKDTLAVLLDRAMQKTDALLEGENRSKLASLIVTGSFVESLYIATGIIKSYPKNILPDDKRNQILTPLMQIIIKQKQSVSDITKLMGSVDQTGSVPSIVADLKSLEASYKALNIEEQIKNNKGSLALSDKVLAEITTVIEKLRGDIVQ